MSAGPHVPAGGDVRLSHPVGERSDAELLAASRTGDQEAYGELFRRHAPSATALARRLTGHPSDADDLVSEAFTKVLAALKNGNGPTSALRPYLLTAVRRVHVDRAVAAQRVQPTDDMGAHDPGIPFVDPALAGLERSMVAKAYQQLPERWQMVLWHTEIEELSPKDIAPLLGMSPNAVAALALRARAGLREAYLAAHVTTTTSPECERMLPKLAAYVRGSAAARERAAVDRHLPQCEDCRAVLAELQDVGGRMRAVIAPLILGVAATGYLADIAAMPALAAPALASAPTVGVATPGPVAGQPASASATTASSGTAGASAAAAGGNLAGWLVGAAATVIVVGAVAGAVTLGQNNAQQAATPGAEGAPGAGSTSSAAPQVPGQPQQEPGATPPSGIGPAATPGGGNSTPQTPLSDRFSPNAGGSTPPSSATPPAPTVPTPDAATPAETARPTTPSSTTPAPLPSPVVPNPTPTDPAPPTNPNPPVDPPVVPPVDPPVEPPVDPPVEPPVDPPVEPPVDPPVDPSPAPTPEVVAVTDTLVSGDSGSLSIRVPAAEGQEVTVTFSVPSPLSVAGELPAGCTPVSTETGTELTCTGVGAQDLAVPISVVGATTDVAAPVVITVTGPNLTASTHTVTFSVSPAQPPAAAVVTVPEQPITPGVDRLVAITLAGGDPTLAYTVQVPLPAPLLVAVPPGCDLVEGVLTCQVPGNGTLTIPLSVAPIEFSMEVPSQVTVTGPGVVTPITSPFNLTVEPVKPPDPVQPPTVRVTTPQQFRAETRIMTVALSDTAPERVYTTTIDLPQLLHWGEALPEQCWLTPIESTIRLTCETTGDVSLALPVYADSVGSATDVWFSVNVTSPGVPAVVTEVRGKAIPN